MALNESDKTVCECNHVRALHNRRGSADCRGGRYGCPCTVFVAASRQGAPRQALDETRDGGLRQTDLGDHDMLHVLGIAVEVGTLVPSGAAVRLSVDDIARWLDPEDAHRLSIALRIAAEEAMHEDRAGRRG